MRQIQKVNREKERESEALAKQPMKAVYKPDKFAHVDSKVAQEVKVSTALTSVLYASSITNTTKE